MRCGGKDASERSEQSLGQASDIEKWSQRSALLSALDTRFSQKHFLTRHRPEHMPLPSMVWLPILR